MQMRGRFRRPFRREGILEVRARARAQFRRALRDLRRPHYPNEDVTLEKRVADFCRKSILTEFSRVSLIEAGITDASRSMEGQEDDTALTGYEL